MIMLFNQRFQINLIGGDYFKLGPRFKCATSKSQIIVKWFNNHSKALGILWNEQTHTLGKILALLFSVITRWTSTYHSIKQLLECICPLCAIAVSLQDQLIEAGGKLPQAKEAALEVLSILGDNSFWEDAARYVILIS